MRTYTLCVSLAVLGKMKIQRFEEKPYGKFCYTCPTDKNRKKKLTPIIITGESRFTHYAVQIHYVACFDLGRFGDICVALPVHDQAL